MTFAITHFVINCPSISHTGFSASLGVWRKFKGMSYRSPIAYGNKTMYIVTNDKIIFESGVRA